MPRDPQLMSDDERIFFSNEPRPPIQGPVVVRAHHAAVQQTVSRGEEEG